MTTGELAPTEVGEGFYATVEDAARELYIRSQKDIPPDVRTAIKAAAERESNPNAREILRTMIRAMELADERDMLVCQDTGVPIFWASIGSHLRLDGVRLGEALKRGVERATRDHPLRSSIVSPISRRNNQTSTGHLIPVIHFDFLPDTDHLDLLMMPKGSGSENMSFLKMLVPADGIKGIMKFVLECVVESCGNCCPPSIVGVGIGGTSDLATALAKKATARPVGEPHPEARVAQLERDLLEAINSLGIGPQGLGGDTTALAVHVEHAWTHITLNPVAVNMQCWRGERRRAMIWPDSRVEYGF